MSTRVEVKKREEAESKESEAVESSPKMLQAKKLQHWWLRVRNGFSLGGGGNLLDRSYKPRCKLVLSKEAYMNLKAKFFTVQKIFNVFFAWW